jgi:hypothetical protein
MKLFIKFLAGLLLAAGLANPLYADTASPDTKQAVRYLELAEKVDDNGVGTGKTCRIPATQSLTINLNNDDEDIYDCVNDEMDYFKLDNVRSAVIITFGEEACNSGTINGWEFELRTIIDPITTPWISLIKLKDRLRGDIISRGIRLEKSRNQGGDGGDELTCVKIKVSEQG